ncbi:hypothetical protein LX64_02460 [Chitinophaga skermanii]|uniref:Pirin N-terminal domain-containing protein n=1 Tax=Chitinophaga skermanii TaxID=331697 RepID=A0A327QPM6_9BACT|nr:pirin family protein [Chitinophaga skermanii]RAJ05303.1 hypothetical protein LX64_02460 [Chitinophaga skermanii]
MGVRSIKALVQAELKDLDGTPVWQGFPTAKQDRIDPFLLLHHLYVTIDEHAILRHAGAPPHPHRGFSPVTFIYKGGVHHRDSRGNNHVVYEGGTQWLHAGMGIIHSERPPADIHERGGRQEMIQLWVNTPAAHKMDQPSYQPLTAEETPVVTSQDGLLTARIVSGELWGTKGKIKTFTPMNTFMVDCKAGTDTVLPIPTSHHAFVYVLSGLLALPGDDEIGGWFTIVYNEDGDGIHIKAKTDAQLFIASGAPINEKVVAHGPYVMNTETAILEAMRDYQIGKMGILIED